MTNDEIFGTDIALDKDNNVIVAANGELILTNGIDTLSQDIRLRLITGLGTLFYDNTYGSNLPLFINDDEADSSSIEAEIVRRVEADPRVEPYSVTAKVLAQDEKIINIALTWRCVGEDNAINQTIKINR